MFLGLDREHPPFAAGRLESLSAAVLLFLGRAKA
jgi:hypothetical protein